MKKISEFCNIPEITKSLVKEYQIMKKRKIRVFRFMGILVLTACILMICFITLREKMATSNDLASEMKTVPAAEKKTPVTSGSGQKPSFNQLWSRSEVFMY